MKPLLPFERRLALLLKTHAKSISLVIGSVTLVAGLLVTGRRAAWVETVASGLTIVGIALALILTTDMIGRDFRRGTAQLWFQRPIDPSRYYLGRFAEAVGVWAGVTCLLALAVHVGFTWLSWSAPHSVLVALPRILLTSLGVAAIAFGISPWLFRGGAVATTVVFLGGMLLENEISIRTDLLGPVTRPIARSLLFPDSSLRAISRFATGSGDEIWLPLFRILAFAAAWVTLGAFGAKRAVNRHGLTAAPGE